jgi:SOS-response transcriptional repressor LexA
LFFEVVTMLTRKQHELLMFIHERIKESGVWPPNPAFTD